MNISDAFTGAGSVIGAGINAISQQKTNKENREIAEKNLEFQRQQFEYSKGIQNKVFEREDNAVQRRAEDLEKSGLNRLMATGQSANAGAVVNTQAPQQAITEQAVKFEAQQAIDSIYNALKMRADIGVSEAQKDLIRANTVNEIKREGNIDADTAQKIAETKNKILDNSIRTYDYNKSRNWGLRTDDQLPKDAKGMIIHGLYNADGKTEPKKKEEAKTRKEWNKSQGKSGGTQYSGYGQNVGGRP